MTTPAGQLPRWLFVSYGGGHVKALLPVARRVQELGLAEPVYLALTTAAAQVRSAGLPVLGFADLMNAQDQRARAKGEELADQLAVPAVDRAESVAYLGLSYADMEERLGPEAAAQQYRQYGRQAFLPLGVLRRAIERCQPALVAATNSPRAERAAIETARAMGMPSVCLVDLLGIWERDVLARPDYADAVCVLNDAVRDRLVQAGRSANEVHVTGNPAFDTLHDPSLKAQGAKLREQSGWSGLHVCLYASSPEPTSIPDVSGTGDPAFPRRIEQALVQAVQAHPGLALWIRRHPSEPRVEQGAATAHPRIREAGPELPLHACIHGSDEVIVTVSTVGVEASLAGKPVTQVRGSILDHLSPYLAMGLASREIALDEVATAYSTSSPVLRPPVQVGQAVGTPATERVVQVLRQVQERHHGR